jgi:heme exporter protein D
MKHNKTHPSIARERKILADTWREYRRIKRLPQATAKQAVIEGIRDALKPM